MPRILLVFAAALLLSRTSHGTPSRGQEAAVPTTIAAGIYTTAQAARGQIVYDGQCASCHLQDLSGSNQALSLAGAEFVERWNGRSVDELVDRIRVSMPADRAGSLSRESAIDVVTYMLQASAFVAGDNELRNDRSALRRILIRNE
jgi:cytochrome c5